MASGARKAEESRGRAARHRGGVPRGRAQRAGPPAVDDSTLDLRRLVDLYSRIATCFGADGEEAVGAHYRVVRRAIDNRRAEGRREIRPPESGQGGAVDRHAIAGDWQVHPESHGEMGLRAAALVLTETVKQLADVSHEYPGLAGSFVLAEALGRASSDVARREGRDLQGGGVHMYVMNVIGAQLDGSPAGTTRGGYHQIAAHIDGMEPAQLAAALEHAGALALGAAEHEASATSSVALAEAAPPGMSATEGTTPAAVRKRRTKQGVEEGGPAKKRKPPVNRKGRGLTGDRGGFPAA